MSIHFQINIEGETTDEAIAEFRKVFGGLLGAVSAGVGAPVGGHEITADIDTELKDVEFIPSAKKTRKAKDKAPDITNILGEHITTDPVPLADASGASSVSIDDLRAKLMALSKTDGGHDKVFTILGKFGAKNASTVPEDKRGEVVALVDEALAGAK